MSVTSIRKLGQWRPQRSTIQRERWVVRRAAPRGTEYMRKRSGGVRLFTSLVAARAAIAKATGSAA